MSPGRPGTSGLTALRRLAAPEPEPEPEDEAAPVAAEERCEMCGALVDERHGHVADTRDHRLLCVCRPCHLLFDRPGAGGVRYRGVGTEASLVVDPALDPAAWEEMQIPVELAFVLAQSPAADTGADPPVRQAFYPGPGGATESLLDLSWWERLVEANPVLGGVQPDIEAVLLRRDGGRDGDGVTCLVVPVDRCYELVGVVRSHWVGLAGGRDVWERIDAFFDDLARTARWVHRTGDPVPRAGARPEEVG